MPPVNSKKFKSAAAQALKEKQDAELGKLSATKIPVKMKRDSVRAPLRKPSGVLKNISMPQDEAAAPAASEKFFAPLWSFQRRDKKAAWIMSKADTTPALFPFKYIKDDGIVFEAADEEALGSWKIEFEDIAKIKRNIRKKLRPEQLQTAEQEDVDLSSSSSSSDDSSTGDSNNGFKKSRATRGALPLGGKTKSSVAAPSPTAVIVTAQRTAWPPNQGLQVALLQKELTYLRDSIKTGLHPLLSESCLPHSLDDVIELKVREKLGADATKWRELYEDKPLALIELLISLLPSSGVKKDVLQLLTEVRLRNTPEDGNCANAHAHAMSLVLQEHRGQNASLKDIDPKSGATILQRLQSHFRQSETAFYNTVGELIFISTEYGPIPTTVWDFLIKEEAVCTAIAKAINLTGKVYPKTVHLLKQGKAVERQADSGGSKKRKHEPPSGSQPKVDHTGLPCRGCGGKRCAPNQCKLQSHPHANRDSNKTWQESQWYDVYLSKVEGKSTPYLPFNHQAVSIGNDKYKLEAWSSSSSRDSKPKKNKKQNYQVSDTAVTNIFNFVTGSSTFNPLISARNVDNGQILGTGILDSGAFGGHINNYVSQAMVDSLIATGSVASTCACHSTKICTITGCIQSSTCVSLRIELFNLLGQTAIIDTIARVVHGLPYNFIIGLTTIRRYRLATIFDSLFEELDGVSELFNEDKNKINNMDQSTTVNTEAVRQDVYTSSNSADSAIKLPLVRPNVAFRGHNVDGGFFRQIAACNRHYATPMGGNPSNSVACKCDTKHALWCVACSTSASCQAVEDQRTYSQDLINLVEGTTITGNKARANSWENRYARIDAHFPHMPTRK